MAWLLLSAGVAWGYLAPTPFLIPIALLMGGTVVGIAHLGEKRYRWAAMHPQKWKVPVIVLGMIIAYVLVTRITKFIVVAELVFMVLIACLLFIKKSGQPEVEDKKVSEIEEKMKQCC